MLQHRGPDDVGVEFIKNGRQSVGLGATRLSIIDLSSAGHMPMWSSDATRAIVYNGEVYNATSLRVDLESRGAIFTSRTDTEVLLHGLALDGPAFLDLVDGMYALAFWDARNEGSFLLARDRFGEKPLFVMETADREVFFASETPALLHLLGRTPDVDLSALRHVVDWGYPPHDRSLFQGIRKVLPATWERHSFGATPTRGKLKPLESNAAINAAHTVGEAAVLVHDALRESVASRLVADVPVGVFLSGGIDSAAVAALAARALPAGEPLNTYTVGYPGFNVSELDPAREVAKILGTRHHEVRLQESHLAALPFIIASLGEPVSDSAALPTYFLSTMAAATSTVLLTGEGADELFFGYPRYLLHDLATGYADGSILASAFARLPTRASRRVRNAPVGAAGRDRAWKALRSDQFRLFADTTSHAGWAGDGPLSSADASRRDDIIRWMPESVLARLDRMTMAASIEARAPFLGREVARLGLNLSGPTLRRFPFGKLALREALKPYYGTLKRWGRKRPFAVPLAHWLGGPLRHLVEDVFFGERLASRAWFREEGLRSIGAATLRGAPDACSLAWTIITIELWARAHIDGERVPVPVLANRELKISNQAAHDAEISNLVVTVDFPPSIGGVQVFTREIWSHGGFGRVRVLAGHIEGDEYFDSLFPGVVSRIAGGPGLHDSLRFLGALAVQLPRWLWKAQTVHVFNILLAPAFLPYLPFLRSRLIVWTYALEVTHPKMQRCIAILLKRADRVVVISEYTRQLVLERGVSPDAIVKIIPGGDDLRRRFGSPDPEGFRSRFGIDLNTFLILSVGRLAPLDKYKGFDRVIEVASTLVSGHRDFHWIVVGGGIDLNFYQEHATHAQCGRHLAFVGRLDDASLADAYAACDLFCLLSREETTSRGILAEGFGIVFVQASSFSKPVVGLRRGGVPDAVIDGTTGILVDEDDAGTIAATITRLMDDPAQRARLGENGLRFALEKASWAATRRRTREMLATIHS